MLQITHSDKPRPVPCDQHALVAMVLNPTGEVAPAEQVKGQGGETFGAEIAHLKDPSEAGPAAGHDASVLQHAPFRIFSVGFQAVMKSPSATTSAGC